jgi:hypothetical protein
MNKHVLEYDTIKEIEKVDVMVIHIQRTSKTMMILIFSSTVGENYGRIMGDMS